MTSPILPIGINFKDWANELRNSFPSQNIPIVTDENEWQNFSNVLKLNRCFEEKYLPDANSFKNWKDWASQVNFSLGV